MREATRRALVAVTVCLLGGLALRGSVRAEEPSEWRGPLVDFMKTDYADPTDPANQDRITDRVWLTRGDNQGLFNIRQEAGYRGDGERRGDAAPTGTLWADGAAADWESLEFTTWRDWAGSSPPNTVGRDAVLHLVDLDVYLDIRVTSWTSDDSGGGFAYERATEGVPGEKVWTGTTLTFTKADDADWSLPANQDRIVDGVWITRQDNRGLFNIAREVSYRSSGSSPPAGTEWAFGTPADIDSIAFGSWEDITGSRPENLVGRNAIVHLLDADVYVPLMFTSWTSSDGGGFSYERATEGVPGERVWSGPTITFSKADEADWGAPANQDRINDDVWITRQDNRGLFNAAVEPSYRVDGPTPPTGTEWAFGTVAELDSLVFASWRDVTGGKPENLVGHNAVVHLIVDDIYVPIRFTSWTSGGNGGGFSYERATESFPGQQVWTGPSMTFTKADYADVNDAASRDAITDNVHFARRDFEGLFNAVVEPSYRDRRGAPIGTEWAYGRAVDHEQLLFSSWETWHGGSQGGGPPSSVGRDAVLHLVEEDVYIDIRFTQWTSGSNGGGFSYQRATEGTPGEKVWSGQTVTFTKTDYADPADPANQDAITPRVVITRADQQGIYNFARQSGYNADEYAPGPPTGTEWAFGAAADWQTLRFVSWEDWHGGSSGNGPRGTVGRPAVLRLIEADVYIDIEFISWTGDGDGGGFSYMRATEGTPGEKVWSGPMTTFTKADYADWGLAANQDRINGDVWIARQEKRGIYNVREEVGYIRDDARLRIVDVAEIHEGDPEDLRDPPTGTEWAMGSLDEREMLAFGPWEEFHSQRPSSTLNKQAILHLIEEDVYLALRLTSWTEDDQGGGFSYQRTSPMLTGAARVKGKLNFKKASRDKIVVQGSVPLPADFDPEGKVLRIDVGGVDASFTLDRKGKAKTPGGKVVFKYKRRADAWVYKVLLKKGDFAATLADDGIVDDTVKKEPVTLTVTVAVDGLAFGSTSEYLYTGKAGKFGKLK